VPSVSAHVLVGARRDRSPGSRLALPSEVDANDYSVDPAVIGPVEVSAGLDPFECNATGIGGVPGNRVDSSHRQNFGEATHERSNDRAMSPDWAGTIDDAGPSRRRRWRRRGEDKVGRDERDKASARGGMRQRQHEQRGEQHQLWRFRPTSHHVRKTGLALSRQQAEQSDATQA